MTGDCVMLRAWVKSTDPLGASAIWMVTAVVIETGTVVTSK
jgi:hypothetical protein